MFVVVYLQANRGYLEPSNDVLSNVTALHNLAEWQVILILSHRGETTTEAASGRLVLPLPATYGI